MAQPKTPADFGYRHLRMRYQRDTVDVLVLSKKGEELKRKSILFFAQGSLPIPLLLYSERGPYPVFVFARPDSHYLDNYHLAIAGKPGVPVVANTKALQPNFTYNDPRTGLPPVAYCQRNYLASFSETQSPLQDLLHSRIPVFVGYGTRDDAVGQNDYLRLEAVRAGKNHLTFRAYTGLEHNFAGFTNGQVDYEKWHWDRVARDFFAWMKTY